MAKSTIKTPRLKDAVNFLRANAAEFVANHRVTVVTKTNIDLSSPGATLDGVSMSAGMSFLATAQTTTTQNGKYDWNGAAVAATRSEEFDTADQWRIGTRFFVVNGTESSNTWMLIGLTTDPPVIGTDTPTFAAVDNGLFFTPHANVPANEAPDDVETVFTFPGMTALAEDLQVFLDGQKLSPNSPANDYSITDDDEITLSEAPPTGSWIEASWNEWNP